MSTETATKILETVSETLKLTLPDTERSSEIDDSLEQLNSVIKLLEISSPGVKIFHRLTSLLRLRLLPLYKACLVPTLEYAACILSIIYEKVIDNTEAQSKDLKKPWEGVQTSLLSGILDFLEEQPTSHNRRAVAVATYPTLMIICKAQISSLSGRLGSNALQTVYQLLSDTVTAHPVNQRKLRSPDYLGGKTIGSMLSQAKDFLAMEALLELFAILLPPMKSVDDRVKRTLFIRDVFNPSTFLCSEDIVQIMDHITTSDWEETSAKIVDALAKSDITFPQPFEITNFHMLGSKSWAVNKLYIERAGFLGNIEESGQLETLQASYSITKSIKVSTPSLSKTKVTLLFSSLPMVGQKIASQSTVGESSVSVELHNRDVARFVRSLNDRGLRHIVQTERKLSKAEAYLNLDFDGDAPISTQDKAQNIQRLWNSNASPSGAGNVLPTSPLITDHRSGSKPLSRPPLSRIMTSTPGTATREKARIVISVDDDDDDDERPVIRRRKGNQKIVVSDDEVEEISPNTTSATKALSRRPSRDDVGATNGPRPAGIDKRKVRDHKPLASDGQHGSEIAVDTRASDFPTRNPAKKQPVALTRKRPSEDIPGHDISDTEHPPSKRTRRGTVLEVKTEKHVPTRRDVKTKTYKKRDRISSPPPQTDTVDFDKLPVPSSDRPQQNYSLLEQTKSKASTMKGKGGQRPAQERSSTAKAKKVGGVSTSNVKGTVITGNKLCVSGDQVASQQKNTTEDAKSSRRSARIANVKPINASIDLDPSGHQKIKLKPNAPELRRPIPKKKLETAPWDEKDFAQAIVVCSDTAPSDEFNNQMSTDTTELTTEERGAQPAEPIPDLQTSNADSIVQKSFMEWFEPLKCGSTSPDIEFLENDATMIDLTNDPPRPAKLIRKASTPRKHIPPIVNKQLRPQEPRQLSPRHSQRRRPSKLPSSSPISLESKAKPLPPNEQKRSLHKYIVRGKREEVPPETNKIAPAVYSSPFDPRNMKRKHEYNSNFANKSKLQDEYFPKAKKGESTADPTAKITEVIGEITDVIVKNASRRFDDVRKDLRAGQVSILLETARDLENMQVEGVEHFNTLVDLGEEYSNNRRKIIDVFEDLSRIDQEMTRVLTETIQKHDRNSLSKKFPSKFFTSPIPDIILNPKLIL